MSGGINAPFEKRWADSITPYQTKEYQILQKAGVKFCTSPAFRKQLNEYLRAAGKIMTQYIVTSPLVLLYIYDMDAAGQAVEWAEADGMSSNHFLSQSGNKRISSIGISVQALKAGREYTVFIFLHELTHVLYWTGHNPIFHLQLNGLIQQYNRETGANIVNDFFGLGEEVNEMERQSTIIALSGDNAMHTDRKAAASPKRSKSAPDSAEAARRRMIRKALRKDR